MIKKTSFVKMDRGIRDCDWYQDGATVRVFNELLMTANVKPCEFEGVTVGRGQRAVSVDTLSEKLALDTEEVRRALNKLYRLGELRAERYPRFSLITIAHYDYYQGYYDSPEPVTCEEEREANEYASRMFWDAVERTRRRNRQRQ